MNCVLKYPGAKWGLASWIIGHFPQHHSYLEPFFGSGGIWYDTVVVAAEYYKGAWTWDENGTEYDLEGIVTHWMPMPEPPKEAQEKEV